MAVTITASKPMPDVAALAGAVLARCREAGVRGLSNALIRHFLRKNRTPNAAGFPRSNFWADAAESVTSSVEGDDMVSTIGKEGVRLRWKGGVVRPKAGHKAVAIPKDPSVARMWPSEYAGPLALVWPKNSTHGWLKDEDSGELLWLLAGATHHQPDDTALPSDDALVKAVVAAMNAAGGVA